MQFYPYSIYKCDNIFVTLHNDSSKGPLERNTLEIERSKIYKWLKYPENMHNG